MKKSILIILFVVFSQLSYAAGTSGAGTGGTSNLCRGRWLSFFSDVCWDCIFPISIGSSEVVPSPQGNPDTTNYPSPICICPAAKPPWYRIGIAAGFWQPFALAEVVRTPWCFPALNGMLVKGNKAPRGTGGMGEPTFTDAKQDSFYQIHWYHWPVLEILDEKVNKYCKNKNSDADIAYVTELDATWVDDELAAILEPEAALFTMPIVQAACVVDCGAAELGLPLDVMFWCAGCNGSMYPMTGNAENHQGGVQNAEMLTERFTAKLHREGLLMLTSTAAATCQAMPAPIIPQDQYRTELVMPLKESSAICCQPYGRSIIEYEHNKEIPYVGEDFVWLISRKRNCCMSY